MTAPPARPGDPQGFALAVDFGTSATKAVLRWPDGRTEPLLFAGAPALASGVHATARALLTGPAAASRAFVDPAGYEPAPKLRLVDPDARIGPDAIPVRDLVAAILHQVWQVALTATGDAPGSVTLTHPGNWSAATAQSLRSAARQAGMPDPRLVTDPVAAAAYAVAQHRLPLAPGASLVVCDHGASGYTASVVRRENAGYTLLSQVSVVDAGGLAVDDRILADLGEGVTGIDPAEWRGLVEPRNDTDRLAALIVRDRVVSARESLSDPGADPTIAVPALGVRVPLSRDRLESIIRPAIEEAVSATARAVRAAGLSEVALAPMLLVGGCANLPLVAALLAERFGTEPIRPADGALAQAIGAGAVPPVGARWSTADPAAAPPTRPNPWAAPSPQEWDAAGPWDRPGIWDTAPRASSRSDPRSGGTPSAAPTPPPPNAGIPPSPTTPPAPAAPPAPPTVPALPAWLMRATADHPTAAEDTAAGPIPLNRPGPPPAADPPASPVPTAAAPTSPPAAATPTSPPPADAAPTSPFPTDPGPTSPPPTDAARTSPSGTDASWTSPRSDAGSMWTSPPDGSRTRSGQQSRGDAEDTEPAPYLPPFAVARPTDPQWSSPPWNTVSTGGADRGPVAGGDTGEFRFSTSGADRGPVTGAGTGEFRQVPGDPFGAWYRGDGDQSAGYPHPATARRFPRRGGRGGRVAVLAAATLAVVVAAVVLVVVHPWGSGSPPAPAPVVALPSAGPRTTATVSWTTGDNSGPVQVAGAQRGGALTVLDVGTLGHLDPTLVTNPDERAVAQLLYRSLTAVRTNADGSGTVIGDLATHPGLDVRHDCTVWRYTLRDGVRFADGRPVTAQDVAYGVARAFDPAATGSTTLQRWLAGNDYARRYDGVHAPGVSTPDQHTIEFSFPAPHCDMPYAATLPTTAPVPAGSSPATADYDRQPAASGPYQVESFDSGGLTLARNPGWDAATDPLRLAGPDTVRLRFGVTPDAAAQRLGADAGEDRSTVSWTANARGDAAMVAATADRDSTAPGNAPLYLVFNLARVPDLAVRQAISYAIDKAAVITARGSTTAVSTVLGSITDPAHAGYAPYPDPYPRDVDKARTLLAGQQPHLTLAIATNGSRIRQAEAIRQTLAGVGITVTVTQVSDPAGLRATLARPDAAWDLALLSTGPAWPTAYRQLLTLVDGRAGQFSTVNDAGVNARLDQLDKLPVDEQNAQAVQLDQKILTELNPLVPLCYDQAHYLHGSLVHQVPISTAFNLPDLTTAYVTPA
jgi:peptide/nickel transport system substrate-binding protein